MATITEGTPQSQDNPPEQNPWPYGEGLLEDLTVASKAYLEAKDRMERAGGELVWRTIAPKSRRNGRAESTIRELVWRSPDAQVNKLYRDAEFTINAELNRLTTIIEKQKKAKGKNESTEQ